ncbi:MAG: gliding motility-associated C-terminal domain-containing protein [Chitinophagales bacterium]|nr:gliding motility-associated C-terminal domain-containing protein [Chitinophagales bacterium]
MKKLYSCLCIALALFSVGDPVFAQTYTDGPIQLQVRFKDMMVGFNETDVSVLGVGFGPDEVVMKVWAQDNQNVSGLGWQGGTCHVFNMGTGGPVGLPGPTPLINETIFNYSYPTPTVPQYFNLRVEAFEDDNSSDQLCIGIIGACFCNSGQVCTYDAPTCCGFGLFGACIGLTEGDDKQCNSTSFKTQMNYRLGPPCQWYSHGYVTGTCGTDWRPGIESYWRYTKGTSCSDPIDLGTINTGGTLTHFNSNECYSNTHAASPGNDVWYKFHANGPIGITASLCGVTGAQFDSYLYLYSSCGVTVADTANDDGCGTQSTLAYSICQAGDYYLVVDGKTAGEMGTFTLSVTDNPNFVFSATLNAQDVSCFGGSDGQITVNVQGGLPPYTYAWSNGASGNSLSGLSGGTYTVSVTDAKGCQATASVQINVPSQLTASATGNPVTCGGACDGSATVTAQGGTTPYSYAWNSLPPQQLQNATFLCAGNYIVTVTDAKSCTVTANAIVPNTTTVIITVDSLKNVQCFGAANGGVYLSATGGQTPYTYAWSNSVNTLDNPNLAPGTYSLTLTDNIGCTVGDSYTITEPSLLTSAVSFTFDPRCNGSSTGIVNITVNGGVQPYSYLWSAPTNATTQNLNNVVAGTHTVTVSDANNCTVTSTATLNQPTPFNVTLTSTNLSCYGATNGAASVTVSGATAPYTYFWSNFNTTPSTTGLHGGPFTVIIDDANGCDTILTGTITEPAKINIALTASEPLCADQGNGSIATTVTGGTAPFAYNWSGTGGFTSTQQNPTVGSGSYTVTVTDANNCTETGSIGVNAAEPFVVTPIGINPNCIGDATGAVAASTTGGQSPFTYAWSNGNSGSAAFIEQLEKGVYSVTVTDANGCTTAGQATLSDPLVDPETCTSDKFVVLVPTAFTPNGDNINDRLVAIMRNVQKLEFFVYNRWGELVYSNTNMLPGDGWDGVYKGIQQPMGTYVYVYNVTYLNGVKATERGAATLIR